MTFAQQVDQVQMLESVVHPIPPFRFGSYFSYTIQKQPYIVNLVDILMK